MHKPSKIQLYVGYGLDWAASSLYSLQLEQLFRMAHNVVACSRGFCFRTIIEANVSLALTNRLFGNALLEYYKAGRALPLHSKIVIIGIISLVSAFSIYVVTKLGTQVSVKQQSPSLH